MQAAAESVNVGDMVGYPPREYLLDFGFKGEEWGGQRRLLIVLHEACDLGLSLAQMLTSRDPLVPADSYHGGVGLAREVSRRPMWNTSLAALEGGFQPRESLADTHNPDTECGRAFQGPDHVCSESCLLGAPRH